MKFIADLHIHSKYSRATSKSAVLEGLDVWAKKKGIKVLGTGDFTHPAWFKEIKEKLEPAEPGLFRLKSGGQETRFLLSVEISSIYSQAGKVRRVHNIIFLPDLESAENFRGALSWQGNINSDGRPILGLSSQEVAKIAFSVSDRAVVIPAHAWTPWFSVFGSMSGFDSLEECFGEEAKKIFALETGLSSDPEMNWQLSKLDEISFISNSDAHSPEKLGREANVFDCEFSYDGIFDAIKSRDPKKFLYTVEFFPEEGKYHYDGHRNCNFVCNPEETKKLNEICPKCGRKMTVGVMNRVQVLADRPIGFKDSSRVPFKKVVPLPEILGEILGVAPSAKKVVAEYEKIISEFGSEFDFLLEASLERVENFGRPDLARALKNMRLGKIKAEPGYDGEFGKISVLSEEESETNSTLF